MKIIKYNKWFVVLKNGVVQYNQEEQYATEFCEQKANEINRLVKGEIRI